jgi:hypothetical protein
MGTCIDAMLEVPGFSNIHRQMLECQDAIAQLEISGYKNTPCWSGPNLGTSIDT